MEDGTPTQPGEPHAGQQAVQLRQVCGAKCRNGRPCPTAPVRGSTRCRMHGGTQPKGPASPNWKHGGYSGYLPKGLRKVYQESLEDPDLLTCQREAALVDGFLKQALRKLASGETESAWEAVVGTMLRLADAAEALAATLQPHPHAQPVLELVAQARRAAEARGQYAEAQEEALTLAERRTKIVAREWRRLEALSAMMTAKEVYALLGAVVASIERHVEDPPVRAKVGQDLKNLVQGQHSRRTCAR